MNTLSSQMSLEVGVRRLGICPWWVNYGLNFFIMSMPFLSPRSNLGG